MEREVTFQTSIFGGFSKKSVLKYIDELSEENQTALAGLNRKISELEGKNKALDQTTEKLGSDLQAAEQKAAEHEEKVKGKEKTIAELNLEIERQQRATEEKERECRNQQDKCRQLTLRAETLEYKGRKYDDAMMQIADAFVEAQRDADEIIKAAEEKAGRMTATTIESIQSITGQICAFKGDVASLRATLQASMLELQQRIDLIDSSIGSLDAAVKAVESFEKPAEPADEADEPIDLPEIPELPEEFLPYVVEGNKAENELPPLREEMPKARADGFFW